MSFATKLCHVVYADGSAHDVMKHPATDKGKISLPGEPVCGCVCMCVAGSGGLGQCDTCTLDAHAGLHSTCACGCAPTG